MSRKQHVLRMAGTSLGFMSASTDLMVGRKMSTWKVEGSCSCGKVLTRNRTVILDGEAMCYSCNEKAFNRRNK